MLADVIKQQRENRKQEILKEIEEYNKPYKRDTIIYFSDIHIIGGIETWIKNLHEEYEFSVVYDTGDKERLEEYKTLGIETIKNVGQPIECDTLLFMLWSDKANIKAKKRYLFIHGIYETMEQIGEIPECDEIYAVSKVAANQFEKTSGREVKVLYNPVKLELTTKPLFLGVFSRLTNEKGKWRIQYLIEKLQASKKPFLMLIFTDLPFECDDNRVVFIPPEMNPNGWMSKCDYIVQLSDTEAGPLTIQEALKMGKPIIVTKLPILEEFGINKTNAKIIDFDMSNLDIEDLWNIPQVKWKEPISKEWDFMKKRMFKEVYNPTQAEVVENTITINLEDKPKKTKKKVS